MPLDGEPFRGPFPKPDKTSKTPTRTIDRKATTKAVLAERGCFCGGSLPGCDGVAATGHHLVSRGQGGDDVQANIVPCSGSGTTGCHGLLENNDLLARQVLGAYLKSERPDTIAYVHEKKGRRAGNDWLRRRFYTPRAKASNGK